MAKVTITGSARNIGNMLRPKPSKIRYMHMMEGRPAAFYYRNGICFTTNRIKLASSLVQIRKEQRASMRIRGETDKSIYGYATVKI